MRSAEDVQKPVKSPGRSKDARLRFGCGPKERPRAPLKPTTGTRGLFNSRGPGRGSCRCLAPSRRQVHFSGSLLPELSGPSSAHLPSITTQVGPVIGKSDAARKRSLQCRCSGRIPVHFTRDESPPSTYFSPARRAILHLLKAHVLRGLPLQKRTNLRGPGPVWYCQSMNVS